MKLDPVAVGAMSERVRTAVAAAKPEDWARALKRLPAGELRSAIAAIRDAAIDKPKRRTANNLVVKTPFFHHGDLAVTGNLRVVAPFFVTGHVTVSGVMMDCGPDSAVAIGGDLRVKHLHTDGEFACGDIEAPDGVVYGYYNDNTLDCSRIRARVVIADEHDIQPSAVKAAVDYSDLSTYQQGYGKGVSTRLRRVFIDDVFEAEDDISDGVATLDHGKLFARLCAGKPVFRGATKSATKSATRPATKSATRPATKSATRPATKSATKSATRPATKSATRPATKSATKSATTRR